MDNTNVNWYNEEWPSVGDIVMASVLSVDEAGAKCTLVEYGGKEAFVTLAESMKKKGRSWVKLDFLRVSDDEQIIKTGGMKEMQVIAVDIKRSQIDLSPRYVTPKDVVECTNRFEKGRRVHNLLKYLSEVHKCSLLELYEKYVYPLEERPWDTFESLIRQPEEDRLNIAASLYGEGIRDSPLFQSLLTKLSHQLTAKQVRLESQINVTCYSDNGILAIKEALLKGIKYDTNETIHLRLISSPTFSISCTTNDPNEASKNIEKAIEAITESITKAGGKCEVTKEVGIVTDASS